MKNILNYIIIGILIVSNVFMIFRNYKTFRVDNEKLVETYVDVVVYDTIPKIEYKYLNKYIVDTLLVEVNDTIKEYLPVNIPIENLLYSNTLYKDKDTIQYKAFLSGYKTSLDSIDIRVRYPQYNSTQVFKMRDKGFYWSPQVGIGYGIFNNKPDVYVGFGIGYKF